MVSTFVLPLSPLSSLCLTTYRNSPSRSVPIYLCTFCTQLFCYLNEDILISKILSQYKMTYLLYYHVFLFQK